MIDNSSIWVVSDVDGTLMDHSYDLSPAKETIKKLQKLSIPVILCIQRITGIDNFCSFLIVSLAGDKSYE